MASHKQQKPDAAQVNLSYSLLYLASSVGLSFFFSHSMSTLQGRSTAVILGFALLIYFIWDFVRQLYSPGQAVLLCVLALLVLPYVLDASLGYPYARIGGIVYACALGLAGVLEFLYEYVLRRRLPAALSKRLLGLDAAVDSSLIRIRTRQLALYEYRGFAFGVVIVCAYFAIAYLLLHR